VEDAVVDEATIIQTVTGDHNIFTGTGDIRIIYNLPPAEAEDRRQLLILLDRVKQFWIEGVLKNSVHGAALLDLGKKTLKDAVEHPWEGILELPNQSSQILPKSERIVNIFDEVGRNLLILGEPGSGKTTTLLQLAKDLVIRAEGNPSQPIPLIFNLSTWSDRGPPLVAWLLNELKSKYYVSKRLGSSWLARNRLILLLDGLDEVEQNYREACVEGLNEFLKEFGLPGLVVCSRLKEYTALSVRVKLNAAICLQPLTFKQVENYLTEAGSKLAALRTILKSDHVLQALARSPLMLSVMSLAYMNLSAEAVKSKEQDTVETRHKHLFNTFVERMFMRKGKSDQLYASKQVIGWLSWIAKKMLLSYESIFLIEQLQPSWLSSRWERRGYTLISRSIGGLIAGISVGLIIGLIHFDSLWKLKWFYGLIAGLTWGGMGGFTLGLVDVFRLEERIGESPTAKKAASFRKAVFDILICELVFVLIFFLISWLADVLNWKLINMFPVGFILVPFCGIIFGLKGSVKDMTKDIGTVEVMTWSWAGARKGFVLGAKFLLFMVVVILAIGIAVGVQQFFKGEGILGLIGGLVSILVWLGLFGSFLWLTLGIIVMIFGTLFGGLKGGLFEKKMSFNQGIKLSVRNAIYGGLIVGLPGWFLVGLFVGLLDFFFSPNYSEFTQALSSGLSLGVVLGVILWPLAGLWYGGFEVIRHYTLRLTLCLRGYIPRNCARFLDHACKLVFLQKVGGGYLFIHRLLLDHFASLYKAGDKT
jgi:hypothetical protein